MTIYVESKGRTLGPFTIFQLNRLLASGVIQQESPAWTDGKKKDTTVAHFLTPEGKPVRLPSTKLQRPKGHVEITPENAHTKFRQRRKMRTVEIPEPSVVERLRMIGGLTPVFIFIILFLPFVRIMLYGRGLDLSGYNAFELIYAMSKWNWLPAMVFLGGAFGVAYFSVIGGLTGGRAMIVESVACCLLAMVGLALLSTWYNAEDTGILKRLGGINYLLATLVGATAFSILPGHENTEYGATASWITFGVFSLTSLILILFGLSMG